MNIHTRPYMGESDLLRMQDFLVSGRAVSGTCWHVGNLVWSLFLMSVSSDLAQTVRLWETGDTASELIGFAIFDSFYRSVDWQIHPTVCGCGVEEEMLAWMEAQAAAAPLAEDQPSPPLSTSAVETDGACIALLERRGFVRGQGYLVQMMRSLDANIPAVSLPEGFTVRGMAGKHEHVARAVLHREVFQPSRVTDEAYLRLMSMPGYDPNLDVVAVAPDGTLAAFCICWVDKVNGIGVFEPVGTRPSFRRMGLGHAVLVEGLRRMQAYGACSTAMVTTGGGTVEAQRLYEAVGFRTVAREFDYVRPADRR
ncbi:MAG: GNAT family N-acetyltransferase [Chloroflexi bacterium]|nr:GNAT family N-acetyltransferase [Chloroflexota bacterium]